MESDSMRVAVSAGEAAGIVETVPNGCGRTPGGAPGRPGQSVGASAVPAKPGRGRGPDRDSVADKRRQRGGALAVLLAAVALLTRTRTRLHARHSIAYRMPSSARH